MKCKEIQNELAAYYYKDLEPEKFMLIDTHLTECEHCRKALDEIQNTLNLIDKRIEITPQEDIWNTYLDRVYQRIDEEVSFLSKLYRDIFIQPKLAPVLVTSLVLLILLASSSLYLTFKNKKYEQMQLAENIELFQDFELIKELDLLENFELLQETDI